MKQPDPFRQTLTNLWERYIVQGVFVKNTLWAILGMALRTVAQVVYFILIARTLKPEAFGMFAGMQALVVVFTAFSGWGSGTILLKHVSRQPETFPLQWGTALNVTLLFGAGLSLIVFTVASLIYSIPIALQVALPMAIGDLIGLALVSLSVQAFQAFQRLSRSSLMWIVLTSCRLVMAVLLLLLPIPKTVQNWAILYSVSGLLAALVSLLMVRRELGWGRLTLEGMRGQWREGFFYSVSTSAQGASNDIDKTLMDRLTIGPFAGAYTAAYRFMEAVFIPVRAVVTAGIPRFFIEGGKSLQDARQLSARLLPWTIGWASLGWVILAVGAPLMPIILGQEYALVPGMVVWLGPVMIFRAIHLLLADTLTGSGHQSLRAGGQLAAVALNVALNLWLIPQIGWKGAVISAVLTDVGLAVYLWITILRLTEQKQRLIL